MPVTFLDAMNIDFLDSVPGNAAAYVKLRELEEVEEWDHETWFNMRLAYYCGAVDNPKSAWLHDIYKNRCLYDLQSTYEILIELKNFF